MSKTVSIRLSDEILKKLDVMAKCADRSRAWLMAQAVTQYVEHEAWQLDAIEKSLKKLELGEGKFIENEKVVAWLRSWGTDNEIERPGCE